MLSVDILSSWIKGIVLRNARKDVADFSILTMVSVLLVVLESLPNKFLN